MHRDEWGMFDLSIISKLDGLRIKIFYDSAYALRSLLFFHILPQFSFKNLFIAVFSDTMQRRLGKTYETMVRTSPEIAQILERANIIKIGTKNEVPFGRLYQLIPSGLTWLRTFREFLKGLGEKDLILFHGFSILPKIYGKTYVKNVLNLFESIPDGPTVIGKSSKKIYDDATIGFTNMFYDVVLEIERIEEVGFEEFYKIGVSQSIVGDVQPGFGRFKIGRDGHLVEV